MKFLAFTFGVFVAAGLTLVALVAFGIVDGPGLVRKAADGIAGGNEPAELPSEQAESQRARENLQDQSPAQSPTKPPKYIASVKISYENGGPVYHVRPSKLGRLAVGDELDTAWLQAVKKGVPNRKGLKNQFLCHPLSIIARGKPTWDLESWRPTLGLRGTMLAACNPR